MQKIEEYLEFIDTRGPDEYNQVENIDWMQININWWVWNPCKGKSSKMFLELLKEYDFDGIQSVLDLWTGSWILALYMHRLGIPNIVATDNMPQAVENAQINADMNHATNMKIIQSDLFQNLVGKFDLVLFNAPATHPLRRNVPEKLQPLWSTEENIRLRFLQNLWNYLNPKGKALLMFSIFEDYNPIPAELLSKYNFSYKTLKTSKWELSESGIIEIQMIDN